VRTLPKSMTKLMIQANKVKHVLSANNDIPVYIDALADDVSYQTHISRAKFEEIVHDLLDRATAPIDRALKMANVTLEELDAIEMIGGAMRVPTVQAAVSNAVGDLTLGMHLNSDESMALGAAFHGANVSTSFKVRQVGMADVNTFPVDVALSNLRVGEDTKKGGGGFFGIGKKNEAEKEKEKKKGPDDEEEWAKYAHIFKLGSKLGIKKTIAFSYDKDVHVEVNYKESDTLPIGTGLSIEQYDVSGVAEFAKEMIEKELGTPKVSLQFELDTSGLTKLIKAEAVVEEMVMVDEEEVVDCEEGDEDEDCAEDEADDTTADAETAGDGNADEKKDDDTKNDEKKDEEKKDEGEKSDTKDDDKEGETKDENKEEGADKKEKKVEEKKKKTKKVTVQKEKKKRHVRALKVESYHVGSIRPYTPTIMAESKAKLATLAQADKERMDLEESKNKYESYIYHIRNKLIDFEDEITKVTTEEQRAALSKSAEDAEEWMFDEGYTADLKTYDEKYVELSTPAEKAFFRMAEHSTRPKAIDALSAKLSKIEELMKKWETTMEHITEEERTEVLDKVDEVRTWIEEKVGEQEKADVAGDPVFTSDEVPGQTKRIESIVAKLMKKPKPKPEKKNETEAAEKNETDSSSNEDAGESSPESTGEDKEEDAVKAEEEAEAKEEDGAEKKDEEEGDEL